MVLSLSWPSGSYLIDVIGSSGFDCYGFRGPGAGLAHIVVKVKVSLLIVVGRNVLLFFINSLGLELFDRKALVVKDPIFRGRRENCYHPVHICVVSFTP